MKEIFPGVYRRDKKIFTKNLVPGKKVYNEKLVREGGKEYRSWNPYRSKIAGAILKGLKNFLIKPESRILYLGVANGTTASHFSDIAKKGIIFGVETSFKPMKKFVKLCEERKNMIPILSDANHPEKYDAIVEEIDLIYQDISQRNQVEIFIKNMDKFDVQHGILMVKARSIDVSSPPKKIFEKVKKEIERYYEINETIKLSPYAKDHIAIFVEKS
ncbi:MAG TPA: fibrillarin-like rRNA/tRNA 2'-O-methyltransferase [Thermoplasmatales archaeon]|nr:fibrillarin-like rRNA/tRNA 2'-O-methyltransferase [Thermoplasmatales archaeon]